VVRRPKLAHTTASRRRLEVTATVMSSRAPAVDADVLAARPSEDTRLFRAARAFFDTACLVYSRMEATRAGGLRQAECHEEGPGSFASLRPSQCSSWSAWPTTPTIVRWRPASTSCPAIAGSSATHGRPIEADARKKLLYHFKAGAADGRLRRPPSGPAATRRSPGSRPHPLRSRR
jgi:hypothetical protein